MKTMEVQRKKGVWSETSPLGSSVASALRNTRHGRLTYDSMSKVLLPSPRVNRSAVSGCSEGEDSRLSFNSTGASALATPKSGAHLKALTKKSEVIRKDVCEVGQAQTAEEETGWTEMDELTSLFHKLQTDSVRRKRDEFNYKRRLHMAKFQLRDLDVTGVSEVVDVGLDKEESNYFSPQSAENFKEDPQVVREVLSFTDMTVIEESKLEPKVDTLPVEIPEPANPPVEGPSEDNHLIRGPSPILAAFPPSLAGEERSPDPVPDPVPVVPAVDHHPLPQPEAPKPPLGSNQDKEENASESTGIQLPISTENRSPTSPQSLFQSLPPPEVEVMPSFSFKPPKRLVGDTPAPLQQSQTPFVEKSKTGGEDDSDREGGHQGRESGEKATPVKQGLMVSQEDWEELQEWKDLVESTMEQCNAFKEENKRHAMELKLTIKQMINKISEKEARNNYEELKDLLDGRQVYGMGNKLIRVRPGTSAYTWALNLLCDDFLNQAAKTCSKEDNEEVYPTLFPLATVAASLATFSDEFLSLLLAKTYLACPWLLPYYDVKKMSSLDHLTGIIRFFAAVCTAQNLEGPRKKNRLGLGHLWQLLASVANLKPSPVITDTLLFEILAISAHFLGQAYGQQFRKYLSCVRKRLLPKLKETSSTNPITLRCFGRLANFLQKKSFAKPYKYLDLAPSRRYY